MKLIYCEECGVVLNEDVLNFPYDIYDENGDIINELAIWNVDKFVPKVPCPVCGNFIPKE